MAGSHDTEDEQKTTSEPQNNLHSLANGGPKVCEEVLLNASLSATQNGNTAGKYKQLITASKTRSINSREGSIPFSYAASYSSTLSDRSSSALSSSSSEENENGAGYGPGSSSSSSEDEDNDDGFVTEENLKWRRIGRCMNACLKGVTLGAGARAAIAFISLATRLEGRRFKDLQLKARRELKEALRYGLFLGSFTTLYTTLDEFIATLLGHQSSARWRALIAGAVAGSSLLLTGKSSHRTSLAVYIFARAAVLAIRCGINNEKIGWLFRPCRWEHGDTFLMCLSSSQILSSWILNPDSLPASYISFLNKQGGKITPILRGIKDLALGNAIASLPQISEHYKSIDDLQLDPNMKVPCTMIHGSQGCTSHILWFMGPSFIRSLVFYAPIYLGPAIFFSHQSMLRRPFNYWGKLLLQIARSSMFMSAYCASAWIFACGVFRAAGKCSPMLLAMSTFPTGLTLLIEKKVRRMEIALYCFSRALESFTVTIPEMGLLPQSSTKSLKHIDVILFSFAVAIIMHCYVQERAVFPSKQLHILDWIFGVPRGDGTYILQPFPLKLSPYSAIPKKM